MNRKIRLLIKILMSFFLVVYLGFLSFSDRTKDVSMDTIIHVMENSTTITQMQKRDRSDLSRYFSINDQDVDGFLYYKDISPMSVDEVLIVRAKSVNDASSLLESAQAHLESQKNVFGSYGTDQMGLLNDAAVASRGNYVYYFCGYESADWLEAFLSQI